MAVHRRKRLEKAPQDRELWQKLYYKHQKSYLRKRLEAIKLLWDGLKMTEVCERLKCDIQTLRNWIDWYLEGGFTRLLQPKVSGKKGKGCLNPKRLKVLKYIILHKLPSDYGFDGHVWTLHLIGDLIKNKWDIELKKSRLGEIMDKELNLSYQKFHRDYMNADKGKQQEFASNLQERIDNSTEQDVLLWYDEFSVSTRPQNSRAWAEKNTSPSIPSNEKKENATMLC